MRALDFGGLLIWVYSLLHSVTTQFIEPATIVLQEHPSLQYVSQLKRGLDRDEFVKFLLKASDHPSAQKSEFSGLYSVGSEEYFLGKIFSALPRQQASRGNLSLSCKKDLLAFIDGIPHVQKHPWTMQVLDAQAKIPSGVLEGNRFWLGSYRQCLNISVKGNYSLTEWRYCLAQVPLGNTGGTPAPEQGQSFMSMGLMIGLCMPFNCGQTDVTNLINTAISMLNFSNQHIPVSCPLKQSLDDQAKAALVICSIIGVWLFMGTLFDVTCIQIPAALEGVENEAYSHVNPGTSGETTGPIQGRGLKQKEAIGGQQSYSPGICVKLLLAFSAYTNGRKILSCSNPAGSLSCLHGIRFLSMSWVILGHTYALGLILSNNLVGYVPKIFKRWTFQAIVNGTFSVDSFFFLSGLLVAYLTLRETEKTEGKINWFLFYFHRFWRLTPVYMLILMVDTCLLQYFGDGPMWPQRGFDKDICIDGWWKNLLYINNFFPFYSSCMSWTWYLANDMQFYIISPIIIISLYRSKIIGSVVIMCLMIGSFITTGLISTAYEMPPNGNGMDMDMSKPNYFQDLYYQRPYCRIGPYLIGIAVGYLLQKTRCRITLSKKLVALFWVLAAVCNLTVLYGLYGHFNIAPLSIGVSALYNTLSRSVWALGLGWLTIACCTGYGGFINNILSWSPFIPLGRLTYCAYLIHPLVILYFITSGDTAPHSSDLNMIYFFLGHIVMSYGLALVVSLAFEAPMIGLEKIFLRKDRK